MDISSAKFFVKVRLVGSFRRLLIGVLGASVNKNGWRDRMLIINFDGLGDLIMMSGVLKHYKTDFPGKKIYFAVRSSIGADKSIFSGMVDEMIYFDDHNFKKNPWYGLRFVNSLRRTGFWMVVNHDPSIGEILGKEIAINLGAERVIGYEGLGIQFKIPFDANMKLGIRFVERSLFPNYTTIISGIDKRDAFEKRLYNFSSHYRAIYEQVTGLPKHDYAPTVAIDPDAERITAEYLKAGNIDLDVYCVLSLSTSTPHREWPAERFAEVLSAIGDLPVVLVGSPRDVVLRDRFKARYQWPFLDLVGKTSIPQVAALVHRARVVFSNDTAIAHIAVALKKPSLTVLGLGHFGMLSLYGYEDINRWVWSKTASCLCDNWRCIHTVGRMEPAPCIESIPVSDVQKELAALLTYLRKHPDCPRVPFSLEFKNI